MPSRSFLFPRVGLVMRREASRREAHDDAAVAELGRADAHRDDDRWTNEGGSVGTEVTAAPRRAVAAQAMTIAVEEPTSRDT